MMVGDNMPEQICYRCGYTWESLIEHPKACPNCKSYKWTEPPKIIKTISGT